MRVSFIDDEPQIYPLQYGGKARTILALAKSALSYEDIDEVTVMSRSIYDPRSEFTEYDGVNFEKLDDQTMVGRIAQEAEEADILSVHTCSFTFPYIPSERRKAGLIYHLHDVMLATADKGSHLDKALAGGWDAIVSPSEFATRTYKNFAALTGDSVQVHTIPRGIDAGMFYPVPRADAFRAIKDWGIEIDDKKGPVLFFPNRAGVGKGDDWISAICLGLAEQYPELQIITTSDVCSEKEQAGVNHIGWQESGRLKHLYSIADVTMSLSNLPESFSQVCTESIACGTPVLALPFGNLAGLAESLPAVVTCEPSSEAIVASIRQLLENPNASEQINESQRIIEKDYSIKEIGKVYLRLYQNIAKNRAERPQTSEKYFVSPFAVVYEDKAYVASNDGLPVKSFAISETERAILACCRVAVSIDEVVLATGLNYETVGNTLAELSSRKLIFGGKHVRSAR